MVGVFLIMANRFVEYNKKISDQILKAIGYDTTQPVHPQFMRKWEKKLNNEKNILPESEKCLPSYFKIRKYENETSSGNQINQLD